MKRDALPDLLRTPRLELRPWRLDDVDAVLAYAADPEWRRYLHALPSPYERRHAGAFVARQILLDRTVQPAWAVVREGEVIGGVNLRFHFADRLAEAGYAIARRHWNQGYATEAVGGVIDVAFATHADLNRVRAFADLENRASQRVMEKVGMQREGVLRENRVEAGTVMDEAWYGILRREWSARPGV